MRRQNGGGHGSELQSLIHCELPCDGPILMPLWDYHLNTIRLLPLCWISSKFEFKSARSEEFWGLISG